MAAVVAAAVAVTGVVVLVLGPTLALAAAEEVDLFPIC
jgi:hypothetical protein